MACAALSPERIAPSIVAGHPVWVQSPAKNNPLMGVNGVGRIESIPGDGLNVAACSVTTHEESIVDDCISGKAVFSSSMMTSRISSRLFLASSWLALTTIWRLWPSGGKIQPVCRRSASVWSKIHWVVVSSNAISE